MNQDEMRAADFEDHCSFEQDCPTCGFPLGTFACKIRHLSINTGVCKAARDE